MKSKPLISEINSSRAAIQDCSVQDPDPSFVGPCLFFNYLFTPFTDHQLQLQIHPFAIALLQREISLDRNFDLNKLKVRERNNHISMDHAKAELKLADVKKWAAIKKAKKADDKAAKYAARAERKQKEAAEARELADKYAADAKKTGSEAQAARAAADAISKRVEELMQPTGEPAGQPGCWPKKKKTK